MSFNWKLTVGHLFPPFFHQLWKNIISWMSHHNAGNLTFIFSVFFNPILSKLDVWTHPTLPKLLLNHHLHWVSYSASICTWCPSITLEIVFFSSLILLSLLNTNLSKWNAWTQSAHAGNRFHFLFHFFFYFW